MFTFSHKVELAVEALSRLAGRGDEWILARDISEQTGIPLPYLHKILHVMGQAGLIVSKRGYRGGVALARPAENISLLEIIRAAEGDGRAQLCPLKGVPCTDVRGCPIHDSWDRTRENIANYLNGVTLAMTTEMRCSEEGQCQVKE